MVYQFRCQRMIIAKIFKNMVVVIDVVSALFSMFLSFASNEKVSLESSGKDRGGGGLVVKKCVFYSCKLSLSLTEVSKKSFFRP